MRQSGLDHLLVEDTWRSAGQEVSVPATVDFNPGGSLTPQSRTLVHEGLELDLQALAPPATSGGNGAGGLVAAYRQQQHSGAVWIQNPCAPFVNPLRSGLRPVGVWVHGGHHLQVFRGSVRSLPGTTGLFSSARVWVAIRPDRRVHFEWLQRRHTSLGHQPLRTIAERFTYPSGHLDQRFAASPAAERARYYSREYTRLLAALHGLEAFAGVRDAGGGSGNPTASGGVHCGGAKAVGPAAASMAGAQVGCAAGPG